MGEKIMNMIRIASVGLGTILLILPVINPGSLAFDECQFNFEVMNNNQPVGGVIITMINLRTEEVIETTTNSEGDAVIDLNDLALGWITGDQFKTTIQKTDVLNRKMILNVRSPMNDIMLDLRITEPYLYWGNFGINAAPVNEDGGSDHFPVWGNEENGWILPFHFRFSDQRVGMGGGDFTFDKWISLTAPDANGEIPRDNPYSSGKINFMQPVDTGIQDIDQRVDYIHQLQHYHWYLGHRLIVNNNAGCFDWTETNQNIQYSTWHTWP